VAPLQEGLQMCAEEDMSGVTDCGKEIVTVRFASLSLSLFFF
jgi:hypothetical protein